MVGGARRGTKVWNVIPSYVVAGFLVRGQASSFDSQASINIRWKRGEGMCCMPPKHGKGEIREGGSVLLHRKGCVYRKPKQDPGSHAACSKQQS